MQTRESGKWQSRWQHFVLLLIFSVRENMLVSNNRVFFVNVLPFMLTFCLILSWEVGREVWKFRSMYYTFSLISFSSYSYLKSFAKDIIGYCKLKWITSQSRSFRFIPACFSNLSFSLYHSLFDYDIFEVMYVRHRGITAIQSLRPLPPNRRMPRENTGVDLLVSYSERK